MTKTNPDREKKKYVFTYERFLLSASMFSHLRWRLLAFSRRIWVRATLYSVVGLIAALASAVLGRFVPESLGTTLGSDAVGSILRVLAASMLSVTIFALSTLVGALASASQASVRATRLVGQDPTAQSILAGFLGVFIFSLVGIIALSSGAYGEGERFVLFLFTLPMVIFTVAALIRWIQHITKLGRLEDTMSRLEEAAVGAFGKHRLDPQLGGVAWEAESCPPDADAVPLLAEYSGYIMYFDIEALAKNLEPSQRAWVLARPGSFVGPNRPLALIGRPESGASIPARELALLRQAWLQGENRSFDQDPRFGLCVLAEVATKALSDAVNDVGTAIGVLGRLVRVFGGLEHARDEGEDDGRTLGVRHDNIMVEPIKALDALNDAFRPIARDGAGAIELGLRLQATLAHVARLRISDAALQGSMSEAAAVVAADALARARLALSSTADVAELEAAASHLLSQHGLQCAPAASTV